MANVNSPFGARPLFTETGGNSPLMPFLITDSTAVFIGDFVDGTGTSAYSSQFDGYLPTVQQSAATSVPLGLVVGFLPVTRDSTIYRVASTDRIALVLVDQNAEFVMQCSGTIAVTDMMANFDITVGSGSTVTGLSAMEVDSSTFDTTATLPFRVVDFYHSPDNDVTLTNARVICRFNDSFYRGNTGLN